MVNKNVCKNTQISSDLIQTKKKSLLTRGAFGNKSVRFDRKCIKTS